MSLKPIHPDALKALGINPPKQPVPGRKLYSDKSVGRARVLNAAAAKAGIKKLPASDCTPVCNESGCSTCAPNELSETLVQSLSKDDLYTLFQENAKYTGIHIPNGHLSMIQSFDGWMKVNKTSDEIEAMPELGVSNLRLITGALKVLMT